MNHLEILGPKLIDNGYDIIPLLHAKKYPGGVPGWQNLRMKKEEIAPYIKRGYTGVGVLCQRTPAVDLDIRDRDLTLLMVKAVHEICGQAPYRVGMKPKALLPFKVITPFKKITSIKYMNMDDSVETDANGAVIIKDGKPVPKTHQVEILGDGGQFVAFGIHPDTQEEYKWTKSLADINRESLPTMNVVDAKEIIKVFEDECERRGWVNSGSKVAAGFDTQSGEANDSRQPEPASHSKETLGLTTDEREKHLARIDPGAMDYADRLKIGMCIHHETGGSQAGFEQWDKWLQRSPDYDANVATQEAKGSGLSYKWKTFSSDDSSSTFRSVIKQANAIKKELGEEDGKLGEFLKRYVYVEIGDVVHDLWSPQELKNILLKNFRTSKSKFNFQQEIVTDKEDKEGNRITKIIEIKPVELWVKHPSRKTAREVVYVPNREGKRVIERHGHDFLNSFRLPKFENPFGEGSKVGRNLGAEFREMLKPFFDHMEYLFPVEAEREWFLNWMAVNVQDPENRCKVTPLHVNINQGTGRGWVVELMGQLLGNWNCQKVDIKKLAGESQFNGYLANSLLISVEEVHEAGSGRFKTLDKIRDTLTENHLNVNVKFGADQTIRVYANFFFMSNNLDALTIDNNDRRINVFMSEAKPKDSAYYRDLYTWAKPLKGKGIDEELPNQNVCALYHWLMYRELAGDWWMRSFKSESRQAMIENSRSEIEVCFRDYIEEPGWPVMTPEKIIEGMAEMMGDPFFCSDRMDRKQVDRLLQNNCKSLGRKQRTGGRGTKIVRPWILDGTQSSDKFGEDEVKKMIQEQYKV